MRAPRSGRQDPRSKYRHPPLRPSTVAQDYHSIRELGDVRHDVTDHDDRDPRFGDAPRKVEGGLRFANPKRGRRFVHEHDLRRPQRRASDRDRLALASRHAVDGRSGVLASRSRAGRAGQPRAASSAYDREARTRRTIAPADLPTQEQILRHITVGGERKILVDGLDPRRRASGGRIGCTLPRTRLAGCRALPRPTNLESVDFPAPLSPTIAMIHRAEYRGRSFDCDDVAVRLVDPSRLHHDLAGVASAWPSRLPADSCSQGVERNRNHKRRPGYEGLPEGLHAKDIEPVSEDPQHGDTEKGPSYTTPTSVSAVPPRTTAART